MTCKLLPFGKGEIETRETTFVFSRFFLCRTTNILSLDIWRALSKDHSLSSFVADVKSKSRNSPSLVRSQIEAACDSVETFAAKCERDPHVLETSARHFAFSLSRLYIAALFADFAHFTKDAVDEECALRWAQKPLFVTFGAYDAKHQEMSKRISKL